MAEAPQAPNMARTSIQVTDELADELHGRKDRGDSYEDVIWRLIDRADRAGEPTDLEAPDPALEKPAPDIQPPAPDAAELEELRPFLENIDFPTGRDREACERAVTAAYAYLENRGKATMREFVRDVMPEHPLGYDVPELEQGDRFRGAWWRHIVKPGLKALPDVRAPAGGETHWSLEDPQNAD